MGAFRDAMVEALALRGLAPRTRATYLHWVRRLVVLGGHFKTGH